MSKNKTKKHRHKKHKTRNKTRIKTKSHNKTKTKTRKITRSLNIRQDVLLLPNRTPKNIDELSQDIDDETTNKSLKMIDPASSYSPSVNKELPSKEKSSS